MKQSYETLTVSAPGRICLFGEHQDYLNLPVIPMAISLRIAIEGKRRDDRIIALNLPDIKERESFILQPELPYVAERDYFRSVVNVLQRENLTFKTGFDCTVKGNIPINSGTSSSSALIVTWVDFLSRMSDQALELSPEMVAHYAYLSEVTEFSEPGGMMDHYATAVGGVFFLKSFPHIELERLNPDLKTFVLGDSGQPKDTKWILQHVKDRVIDIVDTLSQHHPEFSLQSMSLQDVEGYKNDLDDEPYQLLQGTVKNHEITQQALGLLKQKPLDHKKVGELLNRHQDILRDVLHISTPKIDHMIQASLDAGAFGAKINGSGGGGCMFAYAPENPEKVAQAIEAAGGRAFIVTADRGASINGAMV